MQQMFILELIVEKHKQMAHPVIYVFLLRYIKFNNCLVRCFKIANNIVWRETI